MSKLQIQKIKVLQKQVRDFSNCLEEKCFDCSGKQSHGPGWDCDLVNCAFYKIRPKTVFYKSRARTKFGPSVFSVVDRKPAKSKRNKRNAKIGT